MVPTPNFASGEEVLPYLCRHYHQLTMAEITRACAWGLDPGFAQRDTIAHFLQSLPTIQQNQLPPQEADCQICFRPFSAHSSSSNVGPAVRLRCGHIVGSACLCEWLKRHDSCPHCHTNVFPNPTEDEWPKQSPSNPRHAQVLRGMLESGQKFLAEIRSGSGSIYVEGYSVFRKWAFATPSGGMSDGSIVARIHARAHVSRWEAFNSSPSGAL